MHPELTVQQAADIFRAVCLAEMLSYFEQTQKLDAEELRGLTGLLFPGIELE